MKGSVTLLGGRTTWGLGKEWKGLNEVKGVGMSLGVTWRVREGTPNKKGVHHPF
jgi:hypothetical protein